MLSHDELYEGLPKEKAEGWRKEAREKWGNDVVEKSEMQLLTMTREDLAGLRTAFSENWKKLAGLSQGDPTGAEAQEAVLLHYRQIRQFWGTAGSSDPQWQAYKCLGEMYTQDDRYTVIDGQPNPAFAVFLQKAISHFVAAQQA